MRKEILVVGPVMLLLLAGCSGQRGVPAAAPMPTAVQGAPVSAKVPTSAPIPVTAPAPAPIPVPAPAPVPGTAPTQANPSAPSSAPNIPSTASPPTAMPPVAPSGFTQTGPSGTATAEAGTASAGVAAGTSAADQPRVLDNPAQVTMADNGATVIMKVNGRLLLNLGSTPDWQPTVEDQSVLARVPNVMVIRGAQGLYAAKAVGTTTLSAVGTFPCQFSTPRCMIASPLFRITVEVKG